MPEFITLALYTGKALTKSKSGQICKDLLICSCRFLKEVKEMNLGKIGKMLERIGIKLEKEAKVKKPAPKKKKKKR